jgi:hypothetical protein
VRWFRVSEKAGCGGIDNTTPEASIDCMRGKSFKELLKAIKPGGVTSSAGGLGKIGSALLDLDRHGETRVLPSQAMSMC